jgi:hypothetical protein
MKMQVLGFCALTIGCVGSVITAGETAGLYTGKFGSSYNANNATSLQPRTDNSGILDIVQQFTTHTGQQWLRVGSFIPYQIPPRNLIESLRETKNPTLTVLCALGSGIGIAGFVNNVLRPGNQAALFYYAMCALVGSLGLQTTTTNQAPWYRNPATPPVLGLLSGIAMRIGWLSLNI